MQKQGYYELIEMEKGAEALVNAVMEGYGAKDFVECFFHDLCFDDQKRFIEIAQAKVAVA